MAIARTWLPLGLLLGFALYVATALAPHTLGDDAAITFRYAERLASGEGFGYNAHESVQGASNPLYVLILAALHFAGADIESSARVLGACFFATSVLLTAQLTARSSRPWLGWLAGLALACDGFYRAQALSGMESVLAANLGLLAILFGGLGREIAAGLCVGLAVVNKLDAGMLAAAIGIAWLGAYRRLPFRLIATALATAAPWFVFAEHRFGSLLPNSMQVKLEHHLTAFDPTWIVSYFHAYHLVPMLVPIALRLAAWARSAAPVQFATLSLAGWFLLHALAYSVLDLGAPYPWYLTVLIPPWFALAFAGVGVGLELRRTHVLSGSALAAAALGCAALPAAKSSWEGTLASLPGGAAIEVGEAFDADRRLAGVFLEQLSEPAEVVQSAFGWVAFESRRPFNDESHLNGRELLPDPAYWVSHGVPPDTGSNPPVVPAGLIPVANFDLASDLFPGFSWFTVAARPDSAIARRGARYLKQRLTEFPAPLPVAPGIALARVESPAGDLITGVPGGARFRFRAVRERPLHLVFTPELRARDGSPADDEPEPDTEWVVELQGREVHRAVASASAEPAIVALPVESDEFALTLRSESARPSPALELRWLRVRLVRGEALASAERLRDPALARAWCRFNPCSGKTDVSENTTHGAPPPAGR